MSLSKWPPGRHIGFLGFQTLTLIWLWISIPNFSGTILMSMGRSLLIFSDVNFKMAPWPPYWIFWSPDTNFSVALNINSYWFSAVLISKWPPGSHIGFFGLQTNFSLALNMNSKPQWLNNCVYESEPIDFQLPHFLNGCLVAIFDFLGFWTL